MYGVTKDQNSVLVNIKGMVPYLFVYLPLGINPTQENLENIQNELNKQGKVEKKFMNCLTISLFELWFNSFICSYIFIHNKKPRRITFYRQIKSIRQETGTYSR